MLKNMPTDNTPVVDFLDNLNLSADSCGVRPVTFIVLVDHLIAVVVARIQFGHLDLGEHHMVRLVVGRVRAQQQPLDIVILVGHIELIGQPLNRQTSVRI